MRGTAHNARFPPRKRFWSHSLRSPTSGHAFTRFCSILSICMDTKSPTSQLLISTCCVPFPSRGQTTQRACLHADSLQGALQRNRAREHLTPGTVHWETGIFREGQCLRSRWEHGQPGKAPWALVLSNTWKWAGMVNKRVSLSPKAQWLQQVKILSEALGPQSSCNFLALLYAHQHCPGRSVLWTLSQQGGCQHPALGTPRSVSQTALSKGKEYTLQTKPLCSSNFVPVKSVQLFHITSQKHSAFPKVF